MMTGELVIHFGLWILLSRVPDCVGFCWFLWFVVWVVLFVTCALRVFDFVGWC